MNSSELQDISFAGSTITVGGITISDFTDDANPVEFNASNVSKVNINSQGVVVRHATPDPIIMSVTVIPGSDSDKSLYSLWAEYHGVQGVYSEQWTVPLECQIVVANTSRKKTTYSLFDGTMISGPGGPSANSEGKMQGRTYTFAFGTVGA